MNPPDPGSAASDRSGYAHAILVLIILLVSLAVISGLIFKSFRDERAEILNINRVKAETRAQLLSEQASGQFQAVDLTMLAALSEIEHHRLVKAETRKELDQAIRNRALFLPQIENVMVLDGTGKEVYRLDVRKSRFPGSILNRIFRIHRDGWIDFHLEHVFDPALGPGARIVFSRCITHQGVFEGVLASVIDPAYFFRRFRDLYAEDIYTTILFDRELNIMAGRYPDGKETFFEHLQDLFPEIAASRPKADDLVGGLRSHETEHALIGLCQLDRFPFYMGVAIDKAGLLVSWRKKATIFGFGLGALILLVLFLTGLVLQHDRHRRKAETELIRVRERSRLTRLMREIAVSANKAKGFEGAISASLELICRFSHCSAGWGLIFREERSGDPGNIVTVWRDNRDSHNNNDAREPSERPAKEPPEAIENLIPAIAALDFQEPVCIPDFRENSLLDSNAFHDTSFKSCVLAPVLRDSQRVAALAFFSDQPIGEDGFLMGAVQQATTLLGQAADRILTREKLAESERRFRTYFELGAIGMAIMDADRRWIDINGRYCDMLGYSRSEMLGADWADLTHPEDVPKSLEQYAAMTAGETEGFSIEKRYIRKDGETVYASVASKCIRWNDGSIDYIMLLAQDVTLRKQAQIERDDLQVQLRQAQKMEAIGTLAGGIAHDFNNILFPILGCTEMSLEMVPEGSDAYENLQEIYRATLRARDLVQQILAFSRQTAHERKPLKIDFVVKEALKLIRSTLPANIDILQKLDKDGPRVLADPTQIHQVVMNLCTNAYHAMRETGGTLTVALKEVRIDPADIAENSGLSPGPHLKLTVADTGSGIEKSILERIFDPYFTTKITGEGTGLGLSVVHGIVKSCKGDIRARSELGKGTVFSVWLPAIPVRETAALPASGAERAIIGGEERILLVDDEAPILRMISQVLARLGYRVETRVGSLEALEAFRADPERFDLVITDMAMPNMTGIALSREIQRIRPDMPIILCTGFSDILSEEKAKSLGIREYIMKPVLKNELAEAIRRALE